MSVGDLREFGIWPLLSIASEMEGMGWKGSVFRIRECAFELLELKDDLVDGSNESWELVGQELRLKSTFLYCDLNQVIQGIGDDDQKMSFTELANKLLYYIEEMGRAVKKRNSSIAQACYDDTTQVLQEVMAALPSLHRAEPDGYWEMDEDEGA